MNAFIQQKKYRIEKIEKTSDGWKLYPTDKEYPPVFISKENYSGKMPPFFRWPRQKLELKVTTVKDFQVSAVLNGHTLFEVQEKDYPAAVKEYLAKAQVLQQEQMALAKERDDAIKEALKDYLIDIPLNPNLEEELSSLRLCLRAYMRLHLFKGPHDREHTVRLNLMFLICKIAQRIYARHVKEDHILGIAVASLTFGMPYYPHYACRIEEYEKILAEQGISDEGLSLYREVDALMASELPPIQDDALKRYLNYLTRLVLDRFATDMATLDCKHCTNGWGRRLYSDEKDYEMVYKEMELLKLESFLLPETFTDEVIEDFIRDYSLK